MQWTRQISILLEQNKLSWNNTSGIMSLNQTQSSVWHHLIASSIPLKAKKGNLLFWQQLHRISPPNLFCPCRPVLTKIILNVDMSDDGLSSIRFVLAVKL